VADSSLVIADPAAIPAPHPRADMRRQISAGRFRPNPFLRPLLLPSNHAGTRAELAQAFLAFALAAPRLAAQSPERALRSLRSGLRYQDPTTELKSFASPIPRIRAHCRLITTRRGAQQHRPALWQRTALASRKPSAST